MAGIVYVPFRQVIIHVNKPGHAGAGTLSLSRQHSSWQAFMQELAPCCCCHAAMMLDLHVRTMLATAESLQPGSMRHTAGHGAVMAR